MFSIVTIIDTKYRPKQLTERLEALCKVVSSSEFNLVVSHRIRKTKYDKKLEKITSQYKSERINFIPVYSDKEDLELAKLRNLAVSKVRTEIILFLDLDIYPDINLFRNLAKKVLTCKKFSIAPCIYLTKKGNTFVGVEDGKVLIDKCIKYSDDIYMHWAIPSSVMAIRKDDFLSIGGFFEGYLGHGYEDFDFMIRLACYHGAISKTPQLLIDKPYRAPLLSEGFRSYLGSLCIYNLLEGNIAFHLYHSKDKHSEYYKQRINNALIFNERMKQLINSNEHSNSFGEQDIIPPLISIFFKECHRRNIDPSKYYALFDVRPRYLLRPRSKWKRLKNLFDL